MRPLFTISVDQADITAKIADRLLNLRITDEAGIKSDAASLTLDNRGSVLAIPRRGVIMQIALGYAETGLNKMGSYTVDEVSTEGPTRTLTISAKAADMQAGLKVRKTRSWAGLTLGELVETIAGEHGLQPQVTDILAAIDIAPIPYKQLDQTNESDLHLLTRLAEQYDAIAKPANGFLLFVSKGEAKAASGENITPVTLSERDVKSFRARAADRSKYASVKAYYLDDATQQRMAVTAGKGEPVETLRRTFPDAAQAQGAARAKLDALKRGTATLSLTLEGRPEITAESPLTFISSDELASGEWIVTRAEHALSGRSGGGLTSQIECETPKEASS